MKIRSIVAGTKFRGFLQLVQNNPRPLFQFESHFVQCYKAVSGETVASAKQ